MVDVDGIFHILGILGDIHHPDIRDILGTYWGYITILGKTNIQIPTKSYKTFVMLQQGLLQRFCKILSEIPRDGGMWNDRLQCGWAKQLLVSFSSPVGQWLDETPLEWGVFPCPPINIIYSISEILFNGKFHIFPCFFTHSAADAVLYAIPDPLDAVAATPSAAGGNAPLIFEGWDMVSLPVEDSDTEVAVPLKLVRNLGFSNNILGEHDWIELATSAAGKLVPTTCSHILIMLSSHILHHEC